MEKPPINEKLHEIEKEVSEFEERYINDEGGPGIEEAIKPLIISLRLHGFNTTGSCGGHEHNDQEFEHPYVVITAEWYDSNNDPEDWDKADEEWKNKIDKLQKFIDLYFESINSLNNNKISIKTASRGWMSIQFKDDSLSMSQKLVKDFSDYLLLIN
ncbi:MAG TPA: hypothetical protein PLZ99_01425 [Parcubacteria group bacterium]|jgi:hypothetical protein|nr:hypothetical protein [Parcubacteria group bacterium]